MPPNEPSHPAPRPAAPAVRAEAVRDAAQGVIRVRARDVSRLFNSLDPSPFRERDLDDAMVEYVLSWARELPRHVPLRLVVHLVEPPRAEPDLEALRDAFRNHFDGAAELKRNEFRQLLRLGRLSLAIGLGVLAATLVASELLTLIGDRPLLSLMREGVIIGGWVAMWRPLEILLYDWWPVRRERILLERLRDAPVQLAAGA
jgi:hypothetical protein